LALWDWIANEFLSRWKMPNWRRKVIQWCSTTTKSVWFYNASKVDINERIDVLPRSTSVWLVLNPDLVGRISTFKNRTNLFVFYYWVITTRYSRIIGNCLISNFRDNKEFPEAAWHLRKVLILFLFKFCFCLKFKFLCLHRTLGVNEQFRFKYWELTDDLESKSFVWDLFSLFYLVGLNV